MSMYLLVAMTVACHLALSSKRERFRDDMVNEQELRPRNDVWSLTHPEYVGVCPLLDQVSVV